MDGNRSLSALSVEAPGGSRGVLFALGLADQATPVFGPSSPPQSPPPLTPHKAPREPRASSRGHAHPRSTQGTATGGWKHAAPLFTPCNRARSPTLPTGSHTPAPTGRKSTAQGKAQRRPGLPRPHQTSPEGATEIHSPNPRPSIMVQKPSPSQRRSGRGSRKGGRPGNFR